MLFAGRIETTSIQQEILFPYPGPQGEGISSYGAITARTSLVNFSRSSSR
jgi:hypothetical protein